MIYILEDDVVTGLESGADVKEELQYMDIVRKIEHAGDCIYEISKNCNF